MGIKKPDTSEVPGSGAGFDSHPGDCVRAEVAVDYLRSDIPSD